MKNRIFMYLFIFSILLVIFQLVNSKSIIEDYDKKLTKSKENVVMLKDSLKIMEENSLDIYRFNFETNDDAMTYIEDEGFKISEFVPFIIDQLFDLNIYDFGIQLPDLGSKLEKKTPPADFKRF